MTKHEQTGLQKTVEERSMAGARELRQKLLSVLASEEATLGDPNGRWVYRGLNNSDLLDVLMPVIEAGIAIERSQTQGCDDRPQVDDPLIKRAKGWSESDLRRFPTATLELIDSLVKRAGGK